MLKPKRIISFLLVFVLCFTSVNVFAYSNDTIRVTYDGILGTPLMSDGWNIKNLTDTEYISIQIIKLVPVVGTALSIQEGDWKAVASDAALTLAGGVSKTAYTTFRFVQDGEKALKAKEVLQKGVDIGKAVDKATKRISNGKLVYDSIKVGTNTYKNVVATKEEVRMKKNQIILKMIEKSFTHTTYTNSNTLKVFKDGKDTFFGDAASKKAIDWCVDYYSEYVYTGSMTRDDLGYTEFMYKAVVN